MIGNWLQQDWFVLLGFVFFVMSMKTWIVLMQTVNHQNEIVCSFEIDIVNVASGDLCC